MGGRRLLIDNDAFVLFAGTGLLPRVLEALGYRPESVLRLHALPHMLRRNNRIRRSTPEDVVTRARVACDDFPALEDRETIGETAVYDRLNAVDDLDPGEALVFVIAIENLGDAILTGDRRALVAFGVSPGLEDLRAKLAGRVICLELVFRLLVQQATAADVATSLAPLIAVNRSLKIWESKSAGPRAPAAIRNGPSFRATRIISALRLPEERPRRRPLKIAPRLLRVCPEHV
jgi:hypothetical protein